MRTKRLNKILSITALAVLLTIGLAFGSQNIFLDKNESIALRSVLASPTEFEGSQKNELNASLAAIKDFGQDELKSNPTDHVDQEQIEYKPAKVINTEATNSYNQTDSNPSDDDNNDIRKSQNGSIEQTAATSQGTVKRHIDVSSPWSGAYVYEDMVVEGMAEIRDHFRMDNLKPGVEKRNGDDFLDF